MTSIFLFVLIRTSNSSKHFFGCILTNVFLCSLINGTQKLNPWGGLNECQAFLFASLPYKVIMRFF